MTGYSVLNGPTRAMPFEASKNSSSQFLNGRDRYSASVLAPTDIRNAWLALHPAPEYLNVRSLQHLLDHDNHEMRAKLREFLKDKLFQPRYSVPLAEERELALARLRAVCPRDVPGGKFLSVKDFLRDPRRIFAAHEIIGLADGSLATKMTVQFNLAGGTILKLGTERHHALLEKMDGIERIGCFALTGMLARTIAQ